MSPHSYNEVFNVAVRVLTGDGAQVNSDQYGGFEACVLSLLNSNLNADKETTRDVFWDLFRRGYITLGSDHCNPNFPFFRLSPFGEKSLVSKDPIRFHDEQSFIGLIKNKIPDLSPLTETYLWEAIRDFYSQAHLSTCVMLGVAAEIEFNNLVDIAITNKSYGHLFSKVKDSPRISRKIDEFRKAFAPIKAYFKVEDIDNRLMNIQSILRISRNEAGHATAGTLDREDVYINLQMFISYGGHLYQLRQELK